VAISTDLDRFRLLIGDTNSELPLLNDVEAQFFIDGRPGSVLAAAADACDALATRFAADYDVVLDGQQMDRSQMSKQFGERARELRGRARLAADQPDLAA
jgi:hypothetical protein